MSSESDDDGDLDAGWDLEPNEAAPTAPPASLQPDSGPPTRAVGARELFQRAGARWGDGRRSDSATNARPVRDAANEDRATLPPPVPESEYVARMMEGTRSSEPRMGAPAPPASGAYRPPMATIPADDPLQFDVDDVATAKRTSPWDGPDRVSDAGAVDRQAPDSSTRRPVVRTSVPSDARQPAMPATPRDRAGPIRRATPDHMAAVPTIETSYTDATDIDPDLLVESPVAPGAAEAGAGALDDLPVDEVLNRVSRDVMVPAMVSAPAPPSDYDRVTLTGDQLANPILQVRTRFAAGDYSGALVVAEGMLEENPGHEEASRYAESCREMVRQMYLHRLGGGLRPVRIVMAPDQLRWLTLDHKTGFLLSRIDGTTSVNELLDLSAMPSLDVLRTLFDLLQQEVIALVDGGG